MSNDFDSSEPSVQMEAIERREEPRGLVRGVQVKMPDGTEVEALEAARKGFFLPVDDPDQFRLGEALELSVSRGDHTLDCRVEVVRKEIEPRRGVATRIMYLTPVAEETLKALLSK
jgi:hypothetical protein